MMLKTMTMYRKRYFLAGILLILLGIQFRMVDSFVLNERTTRALAQVTKNSPLASNNTFSSLLSYTSSSKKRVHPPRWLGLAMITVGAVVSFHAVAIPRN